MAIMAIATPITILIKKWLDHDKRIEKCEQNHNSICENLNQVMKENRIQICGILACLEGLREQGCNGKVTESIRLINEFINESAHKEI